MPQLDRQACIELVENEYFGNVSGGELEKILACFTDDVSVTIRHGDNPPRSFSKGGAAGDCMDLAEFYRHLCGNYEPWFGDFTHYFDREEQRSACTFTVKLQPRSDSSYYPAGVQELNNCNFFSYRDGRICAMTIYYSNSNSSTTGKPTGYPPAG